MMMALDVNRKDNHSIVLFKGHSETIYPQTSPLKVYQVPGVSTTRVTYFAKTLHSEHFLFLRLFSYRVTE